MLYIIRNQVSRIFGFILFSSLRQGLIHSFVTASFSQFIILCFQLQFLLFALFQIVDTLARFHLLFHHSLDGVFGGKIDLGSFVPSRFLQQSRQFLLIIL